MEVIWVIYIDNSASAPRIFMRIINMVPGALMPSVFNIDSGGKLVMIVMTNIIVFVFTER